jgi:CheY-like chemotaxis protein
MTKGVNMTALRVLHVEDEPDHREVVRSLRHPNFATRSCASGQEALVVAMEWLPDILLLDVMMPTMDGPIILASLRSNVPDGKNPCRFRDRQVPES